MDEFEDPFAEPPEEQAPEGEQAEGEGPVEGENVESEDEHVEDEEDDEHDEEEEHVEEHDEIEGVAGEHAMGEHLLGEGFAGEYGEMGEEHSVITSAEEQLEEEGYVEEPPPDPAAPYDLSDSKELLREPFELRLDQVAEIEQLWALFQDYNPAYTDIKDYITEKELIYMLNSLLLMTYTPEQLQELIEFCVRPPHPKGHITYDQFLKMVIIRQRDFVIEEELRAGLQVLDPEKTTMIDRTYLREVLGTMGNKMSSKQLEALIKEVDITNDGTIGIEDVVGTMCIDLNTDDITMLRQQIYPDERPLPPLEDDL